MQIGSDILGRIAGKYTILDLSFMGSLKPVFDVVDAVDVVPGVELFFA